MIMTDEQKYSAVLKELGEVLQEKNTTISCQRWQIDQLKEKLSVAEAELAATEEESKETYSEDARGNGKTWWLLDMEALDALRCINESLRECYETITLNSNVSSGCIKELEAAQAVLQSVFPKIGGAA